MSWIANAFNSVKGWISDRWDEYTGAAQAREANQQAKELATYQFGLEQQAVNQQNEYNNPQNQIQRLKDAGLNPALIYGSGSATAAGNQSQLPRYNAPNIQAAPKIDYLSMAMQFLGAYNDLRVKDAQVNNIEANTQKVMEMLPIQKSYLHANADKTIVQQRLVDAQSRSIYNYLWNWQDNMADAQIKNLKSQTALRGFQQESTKLSNQLATRSMDTRIDLLKKDLELKQWYMNNKLLTTVLQGLGQFIK